MTAQSAADASGLEVASLFQEAGIDRQSWDAQSRINQDDLTALWKTAHRIGGRPDVGLHVLKHFHFRTAGTLAYKMMAAKTFRQSIIESLHQISVVNQVWDFSLSEKNNMGVMKFWPIAPEADITHHSYDAFIGACTKIVRDCFTEETCQLTQLWFAHPDFGLKEHYEKELGCECIFDTEDYAVCMTWDLMDLPLPSSDPILYETLDIQLANQADKLNKIAAQIEQVLLELIQTGKAFSRRQVAQEIGLGERTMLRRLKEDSLTYKDVEEGVCESIARQGLQRGKKLEHIASKLGYSDADSLAKMLKRRTGLGIRELRNP